MPTTDRALLIPATMPNHVLLTEAIELTHAVVANAAATTRVDVLVIKGIGAQQQSLQPTRVPSDVDVLVRPGDHPVLLAELHHRGWVTRPVDSDEVVFPRHSTSLFHPSWPNDIDLHFRYPGLERDAAEVFDVLWAEREKFTQAGHILFRPHRNASVVILALHCLRSLWVDRHRSDYVDLRARAADIDGETVLAQARKLGALACARPFLEAVWSPNFVEWGSPSAEWVFRTTLASANARRVAAFAAASPGERLHVARVALFPGRDELQKANLFQNVSGFALARLYLLRWARGMCALPSAFREYRASLR